MTNKNIGIFVDAENTLNPSVINPIIRAAKGSGSIGALVLFGNWNSPSVAPWTTPEMKETLGNFGAVLSPLPKLRPGKNAADIALTYEATSMTQGGAINEVWIVSSDSDFTPLVQRLSEKQIHVVVFGSKSTPQSLRVACSSFILLSDIQNGTRMLKPDYLEPLDLRPDNLGWFHGFIASLRSTYGFIRVGLPVELFFCGTKVDAPATVQSFHVGDPVEFKIGRNHKGWMAVHVRKVFALRAGQ